MEEKKNQISANDEKIIEQLKQNNIQLNDSWVRKRQQTCTFKDAKKDEVKYLF